MNSRVTLTDVAKRAGVHYTTVSLALRNHPRLPKATRQRLCEIAEHMGYRPDPLLHALAEYRNGKKERLGIATVAYITNDGTRCAWKQIPAQVEIFLGAEQRAEKLGYKLEHFWRGEPQMTDSRLNDVLRARGISAVLIGPDPNHNNALPQLDWNKFAAIKIGFSVKSSLLHRVSIDRPAALDQALRRAIENGYRRVAVAIDQTWEHSAQMIGIAQAFESPPDSSFDQISIFVFSKNLERGRHQNLSFGEIGEFNHWIKNYFPDVLISTSHLIQRDELRGLNISADIGFADLMLEVFDGSLAGVRENYRVVGETAIEVLSAHMSQHVYGVPSIPTTTLVSGTWFDGGSLGSIKPAPSSEFALV
jgi:LacI family transcriptional regulator